MNKTTFDFNEIVDQSHFLRQFSERFAHGETFYYLDELWDAVMGPAMPLPMEVEFIHLGAGQKRRYGALILLFEEAEAELEGRLLFSIR